MTILASQHVRFIHLHVRSGYSYFQSTIHINSLIKRTEELKMPAVAITDDGNMIGAVDCYFRARREEIKGIVGATVTVMPDGKSSLSDEYPSQLVLLCENLTGYRNLCHLLSANSITMQMLTGHNAGLIALSGGMYGEINRLCIQGKPDEATQAAAWYSGIFPQRFFIELHPAVTAKQLDLNNQLRSIAHQLSIPTVATAPCCYLHEEDRLALDVLRQIGKLPTLEEQSQSI